MKEIWRPIAGYEGLYEVSSLGRIKCLPRHHKNSGNGYITKEKIKAIRRDSRGKYVIVDLIKRDGSKRTRLVHRIVAETFIPNPMKKNTVNHINGVQHDNRVENLEWCSLSENHVHAVKTGLRKTGKDHPSFGKCGKEHARSIPVSMYSNGQIVSTYESLSLAAKDGFDPSAISKCARGIIKHHKGYNWRYA